MYTFIFIFSSSLVNPLNIQANVHFQLKNVSVIYYFGSGALYYHELFKSFFSPVD